MWVIDTDVIVAAIRSRTGASAELVRLILMRRQPIALSVGMAVEYEAVATRAEHVLASGLTSTEILAVIDALVSVATPATLHFRWRPQLRDANDEMILEAAVNAGASVIVTFNHRDFDPAASRFGVDLLLPAQALESLR